MKSLAQKIAKGLEKGRTFDGSHKYDLDHQPTDWTRFFRCPLCIRDGQSEHHHRVRLYHSDQLDLLRFKPIKKKQVIYRPVGHTITKPEQQKLLAEIAARLQPGQRNDQLHKIFYRIWKCWPTDAADLFEPIAQIAENAGLDRRKSKPATSPRNGLRARAERARANLG